MYSFRQAATLSNLALLASQADDHEKSLGLSQEAIHYHKIALGT